MMSVTHNEVRSVKSNSCVGTDTNRLSFRALRTCRVVRTCTVRQVMRDDHRRGGGGEGWHLTMPMRQIVGKR